MRIAMIGQKGIPAQSGGIEQHVDVLSRLLAKRGHEVYVYCRRWYCGPSDSHDDGGTRRIFRASIPTKHLDAITHTFTSTLDVVLRRADVVHYHAIGPAALAPLARLAGLPVVVTVHGLDWQRAKWGRVARQCLKIGERLAAASAIRLIVVSPTLCEHFRRSYGAHAHFIPNGIVPVPLRQPERMLELGIEPGSYLLSVARLVPEKGLHYLVEAFERDAGELKLVIAGGGGFDADYERRLHEQADSRVIFTGPADRELLAELYHHSRMFVLPSDLEGMSIALLEAMSIGLPVLVSDIPENRCVVQDAGFTFRAGDVDDLQAKLSELLEQPDRLRAAGEAAWHQAAPFQWSVVVEQLEAMYRQCVASPPSGESIDSSETADDPRQVEPVSS